MRVFIPIARSTHHPALASKTVNAPPIARADAMIQASLKPVGHAHSAATQTATISCRMPLMSRVRFPRASILHVKAI